VRTLIQGGMQVMQAMVEVGAETNLVAGLLTAGALTSSPGILAMLEDRFTASRGAPRSSSPSCPPEPSSTRSRRRCAVSPKSRISSRARARARWSA
jgi:hypothetical protein